MVQWAQPPCTMLASSIEGQFKSLQLRFPANKPGKSGDEGPSGVLDPDGITDSWILSMVVAMWCANQWVQDSLPLTLCLSSQLIFKKEE